MIASLADPLGRGTASLRLYPHDLPPAEIVAELRLQSRLAEQGGFDGVMTSEHHGGFANYLPNPLLAATWALEATHRIWAAPCPILLPLRAASHVVEDLAWTAQRFPGRVGAGFAAGAVAGDFELAGVPFEQMVDRFKAALPYVARALAGVADGLLAADSAVAALATSPVPAVSAAVSPEAARRAARLGLGLLFDSLIAVDRAAQLSAAHEASGGEGVRILIRRAWVGDPPGAAVRAQTDRYRSAASPAAVAHWAADGGLVASTDPVEVAERLHLQMNEAGCHALNVRVFHAGLGTSEVRRQIERIGSAVLPQLRHLDLAARPAGAETSE